MEETSSAPAPRSQQLIEEIEERIATGVYAPGTRLDEQVLADAFGVSRTPVREALIQLASAGLVEIRPRRGATVPEIDADRLCEMFEVMAELEAMCARLAARRISPAEQARLMQAHRECEAARDSGDTDRYYQCNEVLHQRIYEAGHNQFLMEQVLALRRRLRPYRRLQLRAAGRMDDSFDEHAGIVAAIAAGSIEQAGALLRQHVVVQEQRFTDLVASLRQLHAPDARLAAAD